MTISFRIRGRLGPMLDNAPGFDQLPTSRISSIPGQIIAATRGMAMRETCDPLERRTKAQRG